VNDADGLIDALAPVVHALRSLGIPHFEDCLRTPLISPTFAGQPNRSEFWTYSNGYLTSRENGPPWVEAGVHAVAMHRAFIRDLCASLLLSGTRYVRCC
jgi:hypothetical protein